MKKALDTYTGYVVYLGIRFRDKDKIISKYVAKYTIEKNQPVFFNQLKQI